MIKIQDIGSIENLIKLSNVIGAMFNSEYTLAISDTETLLHCIVSPKLPVPLVTGNPIPPNGSMDRCIKAKKTLNAMIPKEVLGIPYRSIANPIVDEKGNVIGCFAISVNSESKIELTNLSNTLSNSIKEISNTISDMSESSKELSKSQERMVLSANETAGNMNETDNILGFINNISTKTNMLGLNAAIEAARAGENGRGFSVVAGEIRKLSANSADAVKKIQSILNTASDSVVKISEESKYIFTAIQKQGEAISLINELIEELNGLGDKLIEINKQI